MKHWPSQIFPIAVLSLLAGLSFLLQSTVDRSDLVSNGKERHDPDAITENFSIIRFDEAGKIKYRLIAPYMEHFPDDDSSLINSPTFISYREDAPPTLLASRHGKASAGAEVVFLWEDVIAHRDGVNDQAPMVARMPDLTVQSEAGFAFTQSPVDITRGNSWLKGTGMLIDNNESTFVLQSQVTGLYYSPKVKK